jgi:uracil phosphoribosyltransferase
MGQLKVIDHPFMQDKITMLRDENTGNKEFREIVEEISTLICYEATKDITLKEVEINTPIGKAMGKVIADKKFAIVPVLRAGIGMTEGMLRLMPTAKVGHIGLYRDPQTLKPVEYYCKLPTDIGEREVYLVDPMLATGGTAVAAITFLRDRGVKNIKLLCIISCPEGVNNVMKEHPDVDIFTGSCDTGLNEHGYIVPGLGDAGDRLFGTK